MKVLPVWGACCINGVNYFRDDALPKDVLSEDVLSEDVLSEDVLSEDASSDTVSDEVMFTSRKDNLTDDDVCTCRKWTGCSTVPTWLQ